MSLSDIIAAVNQATTDNLVDANILPTFGEGGDRFVEAGPPRIVWTWVGDEFTAAVGQGDGISERPVMTRMPIVEVWIWGATRDDVETMLGAVISAVRDAVGPANYGVSGGKPENMTEVDKEGVTYTLTLQFRVPVLRVSPQTTTVLVTSEPITPQVNSLLSQ